MRGGTGELLKQDYVDNLATAAHIQLAGGATNNLDIVNLVGSYSAQLAAGTVVLAGCALAVNQYLVAATAAAESPATATTAPAKTTVRTSSTKASRRASETAAAKSSATTTAVEPGNSIHHVLGRHRRPFLKIGGRVSDCGFITHIILGTSKRAEAQH